MYPALLEKPALPTLRHFDAAASTERRFGFDAFWDMQLQLVHEPLASGAVMWFVTYPYLAAGCTPQFSPVLDFTTPGVSGALVVDAGILFADARHRGSSTPLSATLRHFWTDIAEPTFLNTRIPLTEILAGPIVTKALPTNEAPPTPAPTLSTAAPVTEPTRAIDVTTPYADVLADLKRISPWHSWKKLAPLLGTSHTQLRRITDGDVTVPSDDLARNIDELHRFVQRLSRLTNNDQTATKRLLTTPRERDGYSANDFLQRQDYRNAFRSVMEAASPRPNLVQVEPVPRRWYNEPSRDIHDEVEPED
jgi:hypothetical protein